MKIILLRDIPNAPFIRLGDHCDFHCRYGGGNYHWPVEKIKIKNDLENCKQ